MPRDASGNYLLPTNDSSPAAPRNVIRSSDFNELTGDYATALTDSLSRSGDGAMLADLDMDGFSLLNEPTKMDKAQNLADLPDKATARLNIKVPTYVADRTALKALDTTKDILAFLKEDGREGVFEWTSGDYSTHIAADTAEGIFVKADAIAAASGAWIRIHDEVDVRWFGAVGDGSNATTAFSNAISVSQFLNYDRVVCRDSTKSFKIVELQITADLEIDLYGGTILGDFGAWGTSSIDATPIYWTKNVFYSVAANAPSVTLKNMTVNGQSDHNFQMAGGTPIIDFRGAAAVGDCIVRFENFTMTRGANRIYTAGSGISAPTLLLDYRNMEILCYNCDEVWVKNSNLRSSPGEMLQVQADDARTLLRIDGLFGTKARDVSPTTKWSSSALNVVNCHPTSEMRNSKFYFFTKGAVNWESDGGLIDTCHFEYVDDSSGLDFNEAGSYRFNGATVRNCTFKDIVAAGVRTSGSGVLIENCGFNNVNIGVLIEAGIAGDPAKGAWLRTTQVALGNITVRNVRFTAFNSAHSDKICIKAKGVSATIPVMVLVDGGSQADRQSTGNKPLFGVYGENAWLSLRGYFGDGTTALVYMTGTTGKVFARDCLFAPEAGEGVHTFELNTVTMGKKALVLQNCARIVALDGGQFDFRNTSATLDLDTIHINGSPDFAGTTNNAVIARDGIIEGSATYDPASVAAGASVSTTVTVTGARLAVEDTVQVSPSITPGGMIVSGAITASNTVTVTYFNPTGSAIDLASHTITAYVRKGAS